MSCSKMGIGVTLRIGKLNCYEMMFTGHERHFKKNQIFRYIKYMEYL